MSRVLLAEFGVEAHSAGGSLVVTERFEVRPRPLCVRLMGPARNP